MKISDKKAVVVEISDNTVITIINDMLNTKVFIETIKWNGNYRYFTFVEVNGVILDWYEYRELLALGDWNTE